MSGLTDFLFGLFDRVVTGDAQRKRQRIRLIARLLSDTKTAPDGIRSLDTICKKTGMSPEDARDLLSEMGCEGVTMQGGREGWKKMDTPT